VGAGGPDTRQDLYVPPAWITLSGTEVDWAYTTVPQPGLGNLPRSWPRGKVLGELPARCPRRSAPSAHL
jgi:choline dehydrogenase